MSIEVSTAASRPRLPQLTARDALAAHARDELGISETVAAGPVQAAFVSALTFAAGAVAPVLVAMATPADKTSVVVAASTIIALAILGGLGADAGAAGILRGSLRVTFWGRRARHGPHCGSRRTVRRERGMMGGRAIAIVLQFDCSD